MKKVHFNLMLVLILSIVVILGFYLIYYYKLNKNSYDFKRSIPYLVRGVRKFDLKLNTFYIAGYSGDSLYIANRTSTNYLLKINSELTDTHSLFIQVDRKDFKIKGQYKTYIDSTFFYLFNGIARSIIIGNVGEWKAKDLRLYKPYFQESIPLGNNSIVFRYVNAKTNQNSLRKESSNGKRQENSAIFEKQVDGLFCTSGILNYNHQLKKLTYLYSYRNRILLIDTNLKLIKKIKTIDPIDTARFTVSNIKSNHTSVLTSPALLVNIRCASWKKYLFVQSRLMGKHEDETLFKSSTVLDIYDLEKYKYVYSLYLPLQNKKPITQFKVIGGYIYTLSGNFIYRYAIKLPE